MLGGISAAEDGGLSEKRLEREILKSIIFTTKENQKNPSWLIKKESTHEISNRRSRLDWPTSLS